MTKKPTRPAANQPPLSRKQKTEAKIKRQIKNGESNFYERVLDEAEKLEFADANSIEGLDGEIAILRIRIRDLLKADKENTGLILEATGMLADLVRTRFSITNSQKKGLKEAIYNVIKDIAVPLGIAALKK